MLFFGRKVRGYGIPHPHGHQRSSRKAVVLQFYFDPQLRANSYLKLQLNKPIASGKVIVLHIWDFRYQLHLRIDCFLSMQLFFFPRMKFGSQGYSFLKFFQQSNQLATIVNSYPEFISKTWQLSGTTCSQSKYLTFSLQHGSKYQSLHSVAVDT